NKNKSKLIAQNEVEAIDLKKRLQDKFNHFCKKVGLAFYIIEIEVNSESLNLKEFKEQTAKEDQQIVMQTMKEKEKRDEERLNGEQNKPFVLGYKIQDEPIPMEEILEEESRVTVQGYVFSVDVREIR